MLMMVIVYDGGDGGDDDREEDDKDDDDDDDDGDNDDAAAVDDDDYDDDDEVDRGLDVEYKSQRNETFYDLQLNVRDEAGNDITSLEDSLKDFIREEVLEGDNAYDAEGHGKQRARKGIRFKRFPPVLYIQLKRFMFDPEKMDMCKLNGKMEFPQVLDLEAFAPGSGKYTLHTVIVHSGGVSSGHYYAFVRVRDGDKSQWVKFDDAAQPARISGLRLKGGGFKASGEELAAIPVEDLGTVKMLKQRLHRLCS
eukprot:s338_g21.t1